jgi:hypothetical protein
MVEVVNLDIDLGATLGYYHNDISGYSFYPMGMMI